MTTDEGFDAWLAEAAKDCRQCSGCCEVPCPACAAGGVCDDMPCRCGDRDGYPDSDFDGLDEVNE